MIGIVLVSHSRLLAKEVIRFASSMKFEDFPLINGGGIDELSEEFGTNPIRMMEAIKQADQGDGVLVLVDLGSALMNYQVAIELLDGECRVELADAPFVEGAIVAVASNGPHMTLETLLQETNKAKEMVKIGG